MATQKALKNILLIEDEADIHTIVRLGLGRDKSLHLEGCLSGKEALTKLKTYQPDLILLDVMMPGMDGVETLRAIRKMPACVSTPVIFMTAKIQANEIEACKSLGAIQVIAKPFNVSTLAKTLHDIWGQYVG